MNISNQFSNPIEFKNQLINFLMENKIIGTVAGVGIALASKDLIQSLVGDVVFPSIYFVLLKMHAKYFTKVLPDNTKFDMPNFIKHLISWMFIIIITYFFVTIVFKMLLGVTDGPTDKKEDKKEDNKEDKKKEGFLALSPAVIASSFEAIIQPSNPDFYQVHEDPLHGSSIMTLEEISRSRLQNL